MKTNYVAPTGKTCGCFFRKKSLDDHFEGSPSLGEDEAERFYPFISLELTHFRCMSTVLPALLLKHLGTELINTHYRIDLIGDLGRYLQGYMLTVLIRDQLNSLLIAQRMNRTTQTNRDDD